MWYPIPATLACEADQLMVGNVREVGDDSSSTSSFWQRFGNQSRQDSTGKLESCHKRI